MGGLGKMRRHRLGAFGIVFAISAAGQAQDAMSRIAVPLPPPRVDVPRGLTDPRSPVGFEVMVARGAGGYAGSEVPFVGVAYEVEHHTMRPTVGLVIDLRLMQRTIDGTSFDELRAWSIRSEQLGAFQTTVPLPATAQREAQLWMHVRRPGLPGRTLVFPVRVETPWQLDLLHDRARYEAGETVHLWTLLRRLPSLQTTPGAPVVASLERVFPDGHREPYLEPQRLVTRPSGSATHDFRLPRDAQAGSYRIQIRTDDAVQPAEAASDFEITVHSTQRVLPELKLDNDRVAVGGNIEGVVQVATPTGQPIAGADVAMRLRLPTQSDATNSPDTGALAVVHFSSGANGEARFSVPAPTYAPPAGMQVTLEAVVRHPNIGMQTLSSPINVLRPRLEVNAVVSSGEIIPGLRNRLVLLVRDQLQRAPAAGSEIEITIAGVAGLWRATTDAHGYASASIDVPEGVGVHEGCNGDFSLSIRTVLRQPVTAMQEHCLSVNETIAALPVPSRSVWTQAGNIVQIQRRRAWLASPVLVEASVQGSVVASQLTTANQVQLQLPAWVDGRVSLAARVVSLGVNQPPRLTQRLHEGVLSAGVVNVLVRGGEHFEASLRSDRSRYEIGSSANVALQFSRGTGFGVLVARDLAQHVGERDFAMHRAFNLFAGEDPILRAALTDAALGQQNQDATAIVYALAESAGAGEHHGAWPALRQEPWDVLRDVSSPVVDSDPAQAREDALHRLLALFPAVEQSVFARIDGGERNSIVRNGAFAPELLEVLGIQQPCLGGKLCNIDDLEAVDTAFTFASVGRRHARQKLIEVMTLLQSLSSPDNVDNQRRIHGVPPEAWLSVATRDGLIDVDALRDAWGHPLRFIPARGHRPVLIVAAQAPTHEVVSAGPDGAFGTRDDIRDPFARMVDDGLYAEAVGEEKLLAEFAQLAPAERTLELMLAAFATVALEAHDEQSESTVSAGASAEYAPASMADADAAPAMEQRGFGFGGEGMSAPGYGGGANQRAAHAPMAAMTRGDDLDARAPTSAPTAPRRNFPATLFFVGEIEVGAQGATVGIPLADALTTYRIEAVGWNSAGYLSSARTEFAVSQAVYIDALLPSTCRVGDVLRVPVQVHNDSDAVHRVRVAAASPTAGIHVGEAVVQDLASHSVTRVMLQVGCDALARGAVRFDMRGEGSSSALRADAVERPLQVLPLIRMVQAQSEALLRCGEAMTLEVPSNVVPDVGNVELYAEDVFQRFAPDLLAMDPITLAPRANAELRQMPASQRAQAVEQILTRSFSPYGAFHLALQNKLPEAVARSYAETLAAFANNRVEPTADEALLLAALYKSPSLPETVLQRALSRLGAACANACDASLAWPTLMLSPSDRPASAEQLRSVQTLMQQQLWNTAPTASGEQALLVAMALRMRDPNDAVAGELLRRTESEVFRASDEAWHTYSMDDSGDMSAYPTAARAIALSVSEGNAFVRYLIHNADRRGEWDDRTRALVLLAVLRQVGGATPSGVDLTLNGAALSEETPSDSTRASPPSLQPGTNRIGTLCNGYVWLAANYSYAIPWQARVGAFDVEITGADARLGTRSAYWMVVHNRSGRRQSHVVAEVALPSGADVDADAQATARVSQATQSHNASVLRVDLGPLAPGARVAMPLRIPQTIGGTLRGMGVAVFQVGAEQQATVTELRQFEVQSGPEPTLDPSPVPVVVARSPEVEPMVPLVDLRPTRQLNFGRSDFGRSSRGAAQ